MQDTTNVLPGLACFFLIKMYTFQTLTWRQKSDHPFLRQFSDYKGFVYASLGADFKNNQTTKQLNKFI